ncbi:MAG: hypothetical protein ABSE49_27095, partial [Polyangiaceae bacterium]
SALVMAIGRIDHALGLDIRVLDRATESLLHVLDDARSREVRLYLDAIVQDQGAMVQLMPEAMELYQAAVRDREGVAYQCTASMAPPPSPMNWVRAITSPWATLSTSIFAVLWGITSRLDERYPCADKDAGAETEATLARAFGRAPGARANDGVVPLRSQLHGRLVWAGMADHLDVLGHFDGGRATVGARTDEAHVDWLHSGAAFDQARFDAMTRAIADGMLTAVAARRP